MKLLNGFMLSIVSGLTVISCNSWNSTTQTQTSPYEFVVDAGSSGSRIFVYNKLLSESGLSINDLYESKIDIPLASFANNPQDAGTQGIQPLLTNAINFIQAYESGVNLALISTNVLGTAGMRLVPESQQSAIYQNVAQTIVINDLGLGETKTISGQYEGVYSWADVNYLQNNFNANSTTNGILEVGGASAQIAFATTQAMSESIVPVVINNKSYQVYSTSFLGLGQDEARSSMNKLPNHNACYPLGYNSVLLNIDGNFSFNSCTTNYNSITAMFTELSQVKNVAGYTRESFIGISSVYSVLSFWNIESQPSLLSANINTTCIESLAEIKRQNPGTFKPENQCANAVFLNGLIFDNLAMSSQQLTADEKINGSTLTWTLGYVLVQ